MGQPRPHFLVNQDTRRLDPIKAIVHIGIIVDIDFSSLFLISGDVHKTDYKGNTPLHIAAAYGNQSAVELLVISGSNIFALEDYGRTAARVAAFYQKVDCCRFLDTLTIKWQVQNPEGVQKLQVKAMKDLKKRIKKQEEQPDFRPVSLNYEHSTAPVGRGPKRQDLQQQLRPASSTKEALLQNFELRSSVDSDALPNRERKGSGSSTGGLGGLPGRHAGPLINNLSHLPLKIEPNEDARLSMLHPMHNSNSSSEPQLFKGSSGLPELKMTAGHPTATKNESALATFLHSLDLVDCIQILHREKLDLEALSMCTEEDLIKIGMSLGHRKKLLSGIARRKALLAGAGQMTDTEF